MNDLAVATELQRNAGTAPAEAVCTLSIRGMTCLSCVSHAERALQRTPGVTAAAVNLLGESARVSYRPRIATVHALREAVRSAGYEAAEAQAGSAAEQEAAHESEAAREYGLRMRKFWFAAIVPAPMLARSVIRA